MKNLKIILFSLWVFFIATTLTGCDKSNVDQNGWSNYKWELEIQWLAWEISFWGLESDRTLILSQSFEDHADHLNIDEWKREKRYRATKSTEEDTFGAICL